MRQTLLLALLFFAFPGCAQELNTNPIPHPYVYGGFQLNSGGYAPTAQSIGAGLTIEDPHFVWKAEVSYDNAHKSNDNTVNNHSGHDRSASSSVYFRCAQRWFFGAGASWSQLSTTNYSKQSWRPTFGGGKDFIRDDFSFRVGADYILPGTDRANAVQGPFISFYMPSPSLNRHWFFRETLGIYEFHQTVTDFSNRALTRQQESSRSVASFLEFSLMYRF